MNKPPTRLTVVPFAGVDRRTGWLCGVLLAATLLGMIASAPVWVNARAYPLTPIVSWFPTLPAPWDKCLFVLMLGTLVAAAWFYRQAVIAFLALSFFAYCQDQNRGQPWMYMYWVMLLLTLFPAPSPIVACRIAMAAVYFWSGVQKCNARFFQVAPQWFIAPAEHWRLPSLLVKLMQSAVAASPFVEIAIALALWIPGARKPAIITVAVLHSGALLFLSPVGHDYNWVVWPWNLAMIALIWVLFSTSRFLRLPTTIPQLASSKLASKKSRGAEQTKPPGLPIDLGQTFKELLRCKPALFIVSLYALLPLLSFFGKWPSDFSFSLYSENQAVANVFVTKEFGDRLPPELRRYVQPFPQAYDPVRQGPYGFGFQQWCYETLHVPPYPEPRNFHVMFEFLRPYAKQPADLRMIVGTRGGSVIFYEGDRVEFLEAKH